MNDADNGRFGARHWCWLALLVLPLGGLFSTSAPALAQGCVPDCRKGYVCVKGKCVSSCNPPCPEGERCTSDAECVAMTARSPQPVAAAAAPMAGAYVAPPDKALVVFVRDKGARQDHVTVFDEQPGFLTVIEKPQRHVKVIMSPGKHTFYFGDIVRADLEAGRTYIIRVHADRGMWGWRVTAEPALRSTQAFVESSAWIRDTELAIPNLQKRAAQWSKNVNAKRMRKAVAASESAWSQGSDDWRAARTIGPQDGYAAAEARNLRSLK